MNRAHVISILSIFLALAGRGLAVTVDFDQVSDPIGLFSSVHSLEETGTEVTTITAPYDVGNMRFVYWLLDGAAQRGDYDYPLASFSFTITQPTVVTAVYVDVTADTDADGLLDWYELQVYPSLTNDAASDTDGDGIPFGQEVERSWHPRIANEVHSGVIARSRSPAIQVVNDTNLSWYTFHSEPIGLLATTRQVLSNGTEIVLQGVPLETGGYSFVGWSVNGVRQWGPIGGDWLLETSFFLNGASTATAHYVTTDTDSNSDGVPDVYEFRHLGTNGLDATLDYDGDGYNLKQEYEHSFSPAIPNTILSGVIGRDRANMEGVTGADPNDADADGIPDDWERQYFGTINQSASSDSDGDTYTLLQEYRLRLHPLMKNTITAGVIARSRSGTFDANVALWPQYTIRSQPIGLIATDQGHVEPGTVLTTPIAPASTGGYEFRDWEVAGVSARNAHGYPEDQTSFTVTGEIEVVAHYIMPDQDSDGDGIPDIYEYTIYAGLHVHADDDTDGDGLSMAEEREQSMSPVIPNTITPGVIARSRSSTLNVDLQFFRRSQYVMVDGLEEAFFAADPGSTGTFAAVADTAPALGDWDGDGDLDLFVGSGSGAMAVFENAGSPLIINWVDRTASFSTLTSNWADVDRPAPALGDWSLDGRADLAVGGRTGVVRLVESLGPFDAPLDPLSAIEVLTGSSNAVPAFGDVNGDGLPDLLVLLDDGTVDAYHHTGVSTNPYPASPSAQDILGMSIADATGLTAGRVSDDALDDILASDLGGRIWEFRQEPDHSFSIVSQIYGGTFDGFATRLTVAAGDPDGDGDCDIVAGYAEGGLIYMRNDEPHLLIDPPSVTVVSGGGQTFGALGTVAPVTWSFVENRSSGTVDAATGVYTSGAGNGVVDVIEGRLASGLRGRSYVNVIGAADVAAAGKAVIVAGGKSKDDPVWWATDHMAEYAYGVLRFRGFAEETVQYLSYHENIPAGTPARDYLDGESSYANVADAFTNWVIQGAAPSKLLVYMGDHGSDAGGGGQMRLNSGESLPAADLDQWLDDLQDAYDTDVILVMDFCYSGSFLDELTYHGSAQRVVVASTASDELTYFVAGGRVSFSDVFFNAVFQGFDTLTAFEQAQAAMAQYQLAHLDDDKNGIYELSIDGAIAEGEIVGASFIVGRDVPVINRVNPAVVLAEGSNAEVWAGEVSSVYPIERAWATITPPSHQPDTGSAIPVVDLPEVDLTYNRGTRRYEATVTGLTEAGTYLVVFQVQDIWGGVSFPRQTVITQAGRDERVILVAGGSSNPTASSNINYIARFAYETFRARLFDDEHIYYLNADTNLDYNADGTNDVDGLPTLTNLEFAITSWAGSTNWGGPADDLTLYLVGEGTNTLRLSTNEVLSGADLAMWLDAYQVSNRTVNVVMDFSGSGAFIPALPPPPARERLLVASSRAGRRSIVERGGTVSFSQYFLSEIRGGSTIGRAVTEARKATRRVSGRLRQRGQIDDNGNAIANEKNVDGLFAATRYIGPAFVTGEDIPHIGAVLPPITLTNSSLLTLWAADVTDVDGISNVWCVVTEPDYDGFGELLQTNLTWNPGSLRYEADLALFAKAGIYQLTFYASDTAGTLSEPVQSEVIKIVDPQGPDEYEPDDIVEQATGFPGMSQLHTLHLTNDADWVKFYALSNLVYDIETLHVSTNLDTVIEVYYQRPDGGLDPVDYVDEFGFDEGEYTGLDFPAQGLYYVRVTPYVEEGFDPGAYQLVIATPAGGAESLVVVLAYDMLSLGPLPAGSRAVLQSGAPDEQVFPPASAGDVSTVSFADKPDANYQLYLSDLPPGYLHTGSFPSNYVIGVQGNSWHWPYFEVAPYALVTGEIHDAESGLPLDDAWISFTALDGVIAGQTYTGYPNTGSGARWQTTAGGALPPDVWLPAASWEMRIEKPGFTSYTLTLPSLLLNELVDLGTIEMDLWTCAIDPLPFPDLAELSWPIDAGSVYRVWVTGNLLLSNDWSLAFGPWNAPSNGVMQWTDPGIDANEFRIYRLEAESTTP